MHKLLIRTAVTGLATAALLSLAPAAFAQAVTYKANLTAAAQVPPNDSKGTGALTATYDPATLGDGQHSVALRYTDAAGNAATSAPVSFTLDTTAPTLSVEVSGSGHTVGHTVSGTIGPADAGAVVTVRDGSAVLGTRVLGLHR